MSTNVQIRTNDNRLFTISRGEARLMSFVYAAIADFEGMEIPEAIPLEHVSGEMFEKILPFLEHYEKEDPKPIEHPIWRPFEEMVPEWDSKFINGFDPKELKFINAAAEYLMIEPLLELIAASQACFMKDHELTEICAYYGVEMPTEEQQEEIRKLYYEKYALPA